MNHTTCHHCRMYHGWKSVLMSESCQTSSISWLSRSPLRSSLIAAATTSKRPTGKLSPLTLTMASFLSLRHRQRHTNPSAHKILGLGIICIWPGSHMGCIYRHTHELCVRVCACKCIPRGCRAKYIILSGLIPDSCEHHETLPRTV